MTWTAARDALVTVLRTVDELDQVLVTPPNALSAVSSGVTAFLIPPARDSTRYAGCSTRREYRQKLTIVSPGGATPETAALLVDAAVEAVDATMEGHVTLGGAATSISAFSWGEAFAAQLPQGSGVWLVTMDGTATVTLTVNVDRSA